MTDVSDKKRLARLRVSRHWATNLFRGDIGIVAGLPDDVVIDNIYSDDSRDEFVFVLHSSKFDVVGEGEMIPTTQAVSANTSFAGVEDNDKNKD